MRVERLDGTTTRQCLPYLLMQSGTGTTTVKDPNTYTSSLAEPQRRAGEMLGIKFQDLGWGAEQKEQEHVLFEPMGRKCDMLGRLRMTPKKRIALANIKIMPGRTRTPPATKYSVSANAQMAGKRQTSSGFVSQAEASSPCHRLCRQRRLPQPGQCSPVAAQKGQGGIKSASGPYAARKAIPAIAKRTAY